MSLLNRMRTQPFTVSTEGSNDGDVKQFSLVIRTVSEAPGLVTSELLSVAVLEGSATGEYIFSLIEAKFTKSRIPWNSCLSLGCDDANVMTGWKKGVLKFMKDKQEESVWSTKMTEGGTASGSCSKYLLERHWMKLVDTLKLQQDDLLFLSFGYHHDPHVALGRVRQKCADKMEEKGVRLRDQEKTHFLWVQDFPLFLPCEDGGEGLESAHHPFTAPHPEDHDLLYTCPHKARSQHYDLVLNGQEIGGGSIRIHNAQLQHYVLSNILKEDCTQLKHLLTALDSGCPPHGGIALGLDRLIAIVCQTDTIRDVIAFPKSHEGRDLMSGAPTSVSQDELDVYHICVKK